MEKPTGQHHQQHRPYSRWAYALSGAGAFAIVGEVAEILFKPLRNNNWAVGIAAAVGAIVGWIIGNRDHRAYEAIRSAEPVNSVHRVSASLTTGPKPQVTQVEHEQALTEAPVHQPQR